MDTLDIRIHHCLHSSVTARHMCLIWLFPIAILRWNRVKRTCIQFDVTLALTQVCTYRRLSLSNQQTVVQPTLKTFCMYVFCLCTQPDFFFFQPSFWKLLVSIFCLKHVQMFPCSVKWRKKLKRHNRSVYPKPFTNFVRRRVVHLQ